MRLVYWLKYFALATAMLMMQKPYIGRPVVAISSRLGLARKEQRPEYEDGRWNATTRRHWVLLRFIEESGIARDSRILDVGCGPGWLIRRLRASGFERVAGCDWHDIPTADFEFDRVDLNLEGLGGYPDHSFDVVIASDVLEHLENPAHMLRELRRVVTSGGHVFVTLPNCWNLYERVQFLLSGNSTRYNLPQNSPPFSHISMFTPNILDSLTDRARLNLVELRGTYAYFWRHFWGDISDPLFSYNVMYHFVPRHQPNQDDHHPVASPQGVAARSETSTRGPLVP